MIFGMFLVSLLIGIAAAFQQSYMNEIFADQRTAMVLKLLKIYSVPLGVILGGIFARRGRATSGTGRFQSLAATAVVLLWNLTLLGRIIVFAVSKNDDIADVLSFIDQVASSSAFLITAVLAYYFAAPEASQST
jgi:hypothetical protein